MTRAKDGYMCQKEMAKGHPHLPTDKQKRMEIARGRRLQASIVFNLLFGACSKSQVRNRNQMHII